MASSERKKGLLGVIAEVRNNRGSYFCAATASFGGMLFGWDTGLIGGVLTMKSFQKSFDLNSTSNNFKNLQGNIVSVLQGGAFCGAAFSFFLGDKLGRRWGLIVASAIYIVGSVIQVCSGISSTSLAILFVSRFIGGFGVGLVSALVPTYIGEMSAKSIRGRCIGMMQLFNVTGIMLSYFVNYGISKDIPGIPPSQWRMAFGMQLIPGSLLLIGMLFQPESPRWLVEKNRVQDAQFELARVRRLPIDDEAVAKELEEIVLDFRGKEDLSWIRQLKMCCENKPTLYRCSLGIIIQVWQQWTGTNAINYYSPQIFASIGISSTNSGLFATGLYGAVKVVITSLGLAFATEQLGRKYCLIIGSFGMAFSMYFIGIHSAVAGAVTAGAALDGGEVFSIMCIYFFVIFYSVSWGSIGFILSSECAPNHLRSLVMAIALMMQWACTATIAKTTPIMLANIGYGTYILFGTICVIMMAYAIVCVPETKSVPLESIHLLFEGNIIKGCINDMWPSRTRAKALAHHSNLERVSSTNEKGGAIVQVEQKVEMAGEA